MATSNNAESTKQYAGHVAHRKHLAEQKSAQMERRKARIKARKAKVNAG